MLYDTCELIIQDNKELMISNFEFDLIRYFITSPVAEADFLLLIEMKLNI
jgi:hypothetical protein